MLLPPESERRKNKKIKNNESDSGANCCRVGTFHFHIIYLFVVDGRVHDDGVGGRRGSSTRRSCRDATTRRTTTTATWTIATAVAILAAGRREKAFDATGRHRCSFSLPLTFKEK